MVFEIPFNLTSDLFLHPAYVFQSNWVFRLVFTELAVQRVHSIDFQKLDSKMKEMK